MVLDTWNNLKCLYKIFNFAYARPKSVLIVAKNILVTGSIQSFHKWAKLRGSYSFKFTQLVISNIQMQMYAFIQLCSYWIMLPLDKNFWKINLKWLYVAFN